MAEGDRLRHLQVRVAGHDRLGMLVGEVEKRALQGFQQRERLVDRRAEVEAQVGGNLVVARAGSVQPLAGLAGELDQAPLDVEMHVLQRLRPGEGAGLDLGADLREPLLDCLEIRLGDNPNRLQHPGMGEGSLDVVRREPAVEGNRGGEPPHALGRGFGEPSRPRLSDAVVGGHAGYVPIVEIGSRIQEWREV